MIDSRRQVYPGLCIHFDHHPHPELAPAYGAGTKSEDIRRYLRAVKPDAIQYHAIGTFGYCSFPTRIGTPVPGLVDDPLRTWKDACDAEGVNFGVYCSTYGGGRLAGRYAVRNRDGDTLEKWVCPNTPYLDEFLLPFLREIIDRYEPAQFWMDGPNAIWNFKDECVCDHCRKQYEALYGEALPLAPSGEEWKQIARFSLWMGDTVIDRIGKTVHAAAPDTAVAFNFAGFFPDGRDISPEADWLSADCVNEGQLHAGVMHAVFLAGHNRPSDMMVYENVVIPTEQARNSYPRPMAQTKTDASVVLAHGHRMNYWQNPEPDGALTPRHTEQASEVARFVRQRCGWTVDNESAAEVAIAYNDACLQDELQDRNAAIRAAVQMLQEAHIPCDVQPDSRLLSRLDRYRVVLFLEMSHMSPALEDGLTRFVDRGGVLLFALRGDERRPGFLHGLDRNPEGLESRSAGHGRMVCITEPLFRQYADSHHPELRDRVRDLVYEALDGKPLVELRGYPGILVTANRREDDLLVHLVNLTPGTCCNHKPSVFYDHVPEHHDVELVVRPPSAPDRIELLPDGAPPEAKRSPDGTWTVRVPRLQHHRAIRFKGAVKSS